MIVRNPYGAEKKIKLGFSWTVFFFGLLVPLIRGDFKWFAIIALLQFIIGLFSFGIGSLIVSFIFAFKYNKIFAKELVEKGYQGTNDVDHNRLLQYIN